MQCVNDREDEEVRLRKMKGMNGYSLTRSCHLPLLCKLPTHPSVFLNITTPLFFQNHHKGINRSIKTHSWAVGQGGDWRPETGEWRVSGEFVLCFV